MKQKLFNTEDKWSMTIVRVLLGLVVFPHGAQKLLGWFGGYGFEGTMHYFTETVGLPWLLGFIVILLEFFGSLALIAGIGTRLVALAFIALASGIALSVHVTHGFFVNWSGKQSGEGFEFFILWIALAIVLLLNGAGKYSVDKIIVKSDQH
jgi:putative oxidoreductase